MQKTKTKKKTLIAWSKDEVKLLKRLYPDGRAEEIAERTGRALTAVRKKAYYMGIKAREDRFWSANDIRQLKRLYPSETAQSIADELGRAVGAVTGKAYRMGLAEELRVWSKKDLNLLRELYPSKTAQQIAEQIGRSERATQERIHRLGLRKIPRYDDCHRVVKGTKEKLCHKCRKWKGESQFSKNRSSNDGVQSQCKECKSKYARKRYERIRKVGRKYLRFEDRHRVVNGVTQKLCRKCNRWKDETAFYKNRSAKDGLDERCRKCSYKAVSKSRKK